MSSVNGYPVWQATYLPFGYEKNAQTSQNAYKFTGYERDSESGLDYANQRYYNSTIARFMTPDPLRASADLLNPQTWNRYAYVLNSPINFIDPLGLVTICDQVINYEADGEGGLHEVVGYNCWEISGAGGGGGGRGERGGGGGGGGGGQPANNTATISAPHGSVEQCLWEATIDAAEDLLGISMVPGTNQDNWEWSWGKLGFIYTGAAEGGSVLGLSAGVDVTGKTADWVNATPRAQGEIRGFLRSQGAKVSIKHVVKDTGIVAKWAGRAAKVLAAKSAYDRYQKCRGY
jgi:RHS repeat-associated protein